MTRNQSLLQLLLNKEQKIEQGELQTADHWIEQTPQKKLPGELQTAEHLLDLDTTAMLWSPSFYLCRAAAVCLRRAASRSLLLRSASRCCTCWTTSRSTTEAFQGCQ